MRRGRGQKALSFPKEARLLARAEFTAVKERGRGFVDGPLASSWLPRPDRSVPTRNGAAQAVSGANAAPPAGAQARVGLTVSSKVGNAVVRNRIKRRLREAVRHELDALPQADVVLVARASAKDASVAQLRRWLKNAARKVGTAASAGPRGPKAGARRPGPSDPSEEKA